MSNLPLDIGIIGQGEITICEIADTLTSGTPLDDVNGIIYKKGEELVTTKPRKEMSCDEISQLPYPLYQIFDFEKTVKRERTLDIIAGRSCPLNCTFCFHPSGKKYVQRSLDSIFAELDYWLGLYSYINYIRINDELFANNKERIMEFCTRIKSYNIKYMLSLRVTDVDKEILTALKGSGCSLISYGIENVNASILKSMRKPITPTQIETTLKLTREADISIVGYLLFGDIEETIETAMNSLNWWINNLQYRLGLVHINTYPGTFIYNYAVKNGIIKDELQYLKDRCPIVNISKLTDKEFSFIRKRINYSWKLSTTFVIDMSIKSIDENNICTGTSECFRCGNEVGFSMPFQEMSVILCLQCSTRLYISPKRETDQNFYEYFKNTNALADLINIAKARSNIIIYGAGKRTTLLLSFLSGLRPKISCIIDQNPLLHGEQVFSQYPIKPIEALSNEVCDLIVVTVLRDSKEIRKNIKSHNAKVDVINV